MDADQSPLSDAPLDYRVEVRPAPAVPDLAAVLLCLPMLGVAYFRWVAPFVFTSTSISIRAFWYLRAFAMLCAVISIFLSAQKRAAARTWPARVNLLVNVGGLALCTFSILRYVVLNLPSNA